MKKDISNSRIYCNYYISRAFLSLRIDHLNLLIMYVILNNLKKL